MATKSGRILKNQHVNEEALECEPEDRRMQKKKHTTPSTRICSDSERQVGQLLSNDSN